MFRYLGFTALILLVFGGVCLAPEIVSPSTEMEVASLPSLGATPTSETARRDPPPTVYPPTQADNGAQSYWGICVDCHGDHGQGLTDDWRVSFTAEFRDCWQSNCHASNTLKNSFEIPLTGVPALSGQDSLTRFSNAHELQNYILEYMPLSPSGSLSPEQSWSLTAFSLRLKERNLAGLTLKEGNAAAIPIHNNVKFPQSGLTGVLILSGVLLLTAIGITLRWNQIQTGVGRPSSRPSFFHHLHPPRIPAAQSRFRYTLGSGGLAIFLSVILLITGLLEMYYYVPSSDQAAISVQIITTLVPYGRLIRNLHYWSAQLLMIVMMIHLLRVVLTGAYAPPRRFNYLIGLGMFVSILLLDFTGYVLRWDEGIRWALVVGTNLLKTIPWIGDGLYQLVIGGTELNTATITRFYGWHVFGLTLVVGILILWHAFRVRRDGGIAVPQPAKGREKQSISRFELVRREIQTMLVGGIFLLLFSSLVAAPIEEPLSGSTTIIGDSGAPWFFLWIQQLLRLGDPFLWGVITPMVVVVLLGLFPYILPNAQNDELGKWLPLGNRIAQALTVFIILVILILTAWGALAS